MDPGVQWHGMKAKPTGYLWSKYEYFLISGFQDIENFNTEIPHFGDVIDFDL